MCGIAGFINKDWTVDYVQQMTDCLAHRGPDAAGVYFDPESGTALGHRRLSILDLSAAANQPFYSRDRRYVMIYNGEVYNFREVAAKYKIQTVTSSDTEVIIEAFALAGTDSFRELNGMFTIVIWDTVEKQLHIARDRVGIKPLYYYYKDGRFAFASELKALCKLPIKKQINKASVSNFLYLGYIPGEQTIYQECLKLKPGHYAVVNDKGIKTASYWTLDETLNTEALNDEKKAFTELKSLVESSVSYCLISDVPVGIFLSGGVDSSLVAAVAQSTSTLPVKTFSIGFKEEKFNETKYARQVAEHIGSNHHEFTVTEKEAVQLVDGILDIYDEPYGDSSALPTLMVSRLARQEVTVALSGDGGDELFMGYGFYYWARRLQNPLLSAIRKPVGTALAMSGNDRYKRASTLFHYPSKATRKSHIFSQEQNYFTEDELQQLLRSRQGVSIDEKLAFDGRSLSWAEQQSFFDIKNYLPEELLVKTDRASMHYSLEVRVPLLDHRLVEFAVNLAPELKLRGNTGKYLLKQVLYDYVPESFFNRPKRGFSIPLASWLRNDLFYLVEKYLDRKVLEECGLVNPGYVETLKKRFMAGSDYLSTRVWALIILHKWFLEKFN